jgi:hypothetical protein
MDSNESKKIVEYLDLTKDENDLLLAKVRKITFVKRTGLPLSCYTCGSEIFKPELLQCICGRPIYPDDESMSAILHFW